MDSAPKIESGKVRFSLNGREIAVAALPFERLSNVLRDTIGLTGTKSGCDAGDCGACTILMDGRQVCACMIPVAQAEGVAITTVEGLATGDDLSPLQKSFLHHGAAQCGICTPGMLMAASALLARNPRPDDRQVADALGGILCRCTGYRKIVRAVMEAHRFDGDGGNRALATPPPAKGCAVGARMNRADGVERVAGTALFGADAAPEDCLWLRPIRVPHARARFEIGDLDAVKRNTPGLVDIITAADIPGENSFGIYPHLKDQPVLAEGQVRYRGEAVMALVGDRESVESVPWDTLPIRWYPQPSLHGIDDALADGAAAVHDAHPDNILVHGRLQKGDAAAAVAEAAYVAHTEIRTAHVEHAYIEPEAGYARRIGAQNDRIEIVACTQAPYMDLDEVARVLGIEKAAVRVIPSACGGGFGGKLDVSVQPLLAIAAWKLNRPVRCVYTRTESMASSTKRHPVTARATAAADAQGNLIAYRMDADFNTGAYASWGPTVADRVPVHGCGPYRVPNVAIRTRAIHTNDPPAGAFRGFGTPQGAIVREGLYDDLADQLGMDPFAFRYRNALRAGQATATGQVLEHSVGLIACLDALRPHWQALRRAATQSNSSGGGRTRRGVGIACIWYGCGNTSLSNPSTLRVTLTGDGTLTLFNGCTDIGQGSTTVMLQICADALGLPVTDFHLVIGDTDLTQDAGKTSASRQTFVSGKAAYLAGRDLRSKILQLANMGDGAEIALRGAVIEAGENGRRVAIDLSALTETPGEDGAVLVGTGTFDPPTSPLDGDGQGAPYATYGFAAQIADLDVDMALGTIRLRRIVAAHDVGKAINPTLTEGQIEGGIAQGIGMALMEEYIPGRTENLHDYLIPTFGDVPEIDVILVEDPEPLGPYGAKGVGEHALVPTPPAILGAIRHATGIRVAQVPVLPHRLRDALTARV